ncbi:hypothetical protein JHK82_018134 [Glycine max]|nr:hypothetical protein JHK82_018134 [Glycine max]
MRPPFSDSHVIASFSHLMVLLPSPTVRRYFLLPHDIIASFSHVMSLVPSISNKGNMVLVYCGPSPWAKSLLRSAPQSQTLTSVTPLHSSVPNPITSQTNTNNLENPLSNNKNLLLFSLQIPKPRRRQKTLQLHRQLFLRPPLPQLPPPLLRQTRHHPFRFHQILQPYHQNPTFLLPRPLHLPHPPVPRSNNSNLLSPIHQTLNLMLAAGITPDTATADVAVRSLCSAGRLDHAVELIKEFASKHCPPDTYTFNFLVKHLCKSSTITTVYAFIDEMREKFDVKPDLVTYTILIDNVCNGKNLNLREAMRLEEGVEPDLVTYNTLIFGLSKSGRVTEARKLLRVMAEKGYFPDEVTYTSLMNGLCRKGDALGALALLGEMEAKGCSPNACTYNTLLHGLCKARLVEKAVKFYQVIRASGLKLDTASYGTFVRALCRDGRIAEAYEVFDYAVESKSLTDVAAYSTLESTLKWLRKAKEQGLAI